MEVDGYWWIIILADLANLWELSLLQESLASERTVVYSLTLVYLSGVIKNGPQLGSPGLIFPAILSRLYMPTM